MVDLVNIGAHTVHMQVSCDLNLNKPDIKLTHKIIINYIL